MAWEKLTNYTRKQTLKKLNYWVVEMSKFPRISALSNFSYFKNNLIKMNVMYAAKNDISNFKIANFIKVKEYSIRL